MDYRTYIILGLVVIAAIAKAISDSLAHEKQVRFGVGKWFNYPNRTWKNKWRDNAHKERFIGSSTIFVWTTDAWHFFNTLQYTATNSALTILFVGVYKLEWYYYFVVFFTISFIRGMVFEYVYRFLNTRKNK